MSSNTSNLNTFSITLNNIIKYIKEEIRKDINDDVIFEENINLYGIINYNRKQFLPKFSSYLAENIIYNDIFFSYTTIESMILDLFEIIESYLIQNLEINCTNNEYFNQIVQLTNFSLELMIILQNIINNKNNLLADNITEEEYEKINKKYADELFKKENVFYSLVYNQQVDIRIK